MDRQQAIDLFGDLPDNVVRKVWDAGHTVPAADLRQGLWLGRACGMPRPMKEFVRRVVGRDYFAKMILDGWGVNVRVCQDGSHAPLPSPLVPGGFKVDLPFRLSAQTLDYGFHLLGLELGFPGGLAQMRDFVRLIDFATLTEVVPEEHLRRVGAQRGEPSDPGELLVGYIAPLGVEALSTSPFGMCWWRDVTAEEVESARAYVRSRRLLDASCGDLGQG